MGNKIAIGYLILSGVIGLVQLNAGIVRGNPNATNRGLWFAIFWPMWLLTWPGRTIRRRRIAQERAARERACVLGSTVKQLAEKQFK